jgi:hypothetical protein
MFIIGLANKKKRGSICSSIIIELRKIIQAGIVAHTSNPNYMGDSIWGIIV